MLSIGEFSEMCHLSPQALRFYQSEGLLRPAETDERTGYRSYAFEQVEQAMLITLLRDTGMSVKLVRQALAEPDLAVALLDRHRDEVARQRTEQDEAIRAARAVFQAQPEPQLRHVPAMTVVGKLVRGAPPGRNAQEWDEAEEVIAATAAELVTTLQAAGVTCLGGPWRTLALGPEKPDDGSAVCIVKVAVTAPGPVLAALPADLLVQAQGARDELSIFMPGRNTMAKYCTVTLRLLNALPPDGERLVNYALLRQEIRDDGVLTSAPVEPLPA